MYKRIEYFLNAILYCLWLFSIRRGIFAQRIVGILTRFGLSENAQDNYHRYLSNSKGDIEEYFKNRKEGFHIKMANYQLAFFSSAYTAFFSIIITAFIIKYFCLFNIWLEVLICGAPIILMKSIIDNVVYHNDIYIAYFKIFEKEDLRWHKKWKTITVAFCISSFLIGYVLGILLAWAILINTFNI